MEVSKYRNLEPPKSKTVALIVYKMIYDGPMTAMIWGMDVKGDTTGI